MDGLLGIRVVESPYVEPGQVVVLGDFLKPEGWNEMSNEAQMSYAIAHGAVVIVRNVKEWRP